MNVNKMRHCSKILQHKQQGRKIVVYSISEKHHKKKYNLLIISTYNNFVKSMAVMYFNFTPKDIGIGHLKQSEDFINLHKKVQCNK
jgi:hypothetical protein